MSVFLFRQWRQFRLEGQHVAGAVARVVGDIDRGPLRQVAPGLAKRVGRHLHHAFGESLPVVEPGVLKGQRLPQAIGTARQAGVALQQVVAYRLAIGGQVAGLQPSRRVLKPSMKASMRSWMVWLGVSGDCTRKAMPGASSSADSRR